ncbi:MAG: DNA adenine methylase [Firmicutes bacterium]|nr:DNA adenine methylase [Bacillota bacterium]
MEDDAERAYRWFVVARNSFGGVFGRSWGSDSGAVRSDPPVPVAVGRWRSTLLLLPAIHERLASVQVEHRDFRDIIGLYDAPWTFFYLDPPYVPETRRDGEYAHELTLEDHEEMVELLLRLKGKAMLSGYDHEVYRPLEEAGWQKCTFETVCHAAGKTRATGLAGQGKMLAKQQRTEVVWMNYDPQAEMPLLRAAGWTDDAVKDGETCAVRD